MAERKTFKDGKELSLNEESEVLRPPPRRKKSLKKSKMDAEKARQNMGPLSVHSENQDNLVTKDKQSLNQGSKNTAEIPTGDSSGVLPIKENHEDCQQPRNVGTSNDQHCEESISVEQKSTNDIPPNDSKAEKQPGPSIEDDMATENTALSISEKRNVQFENEAKLISEYDMGNRSSSSSSTLQSTSRVNGRGSEVCNDHRRVLEGSENQNVAITDNVETFFWVDDGAADSKEMSKHTIPGQEDSIDTSNEAPNAHILHKQGPTADTESATDNNVDKKETILDGNVQSEVKNPETVANPEHLCATEKQGNDNSVEPDIEDSISNSTNIIHKESVPTALESNLSLPSATTEAQENTIEYAIITNSKKAKTLNNRTSPESKPITLSKTTTENTNNDGSMISDKINTNNQEITKESKVESSVPYQVLKDNLTSEDVCSQWEDDNISTDTDSDIFYSDWSSSDEGESMYDIEMAEKMYGVSMDNERNSLSRSTSSSDPVSEILSAFGPSTEYLSVTNDNDTDHGSNQGDGNLDDGSQGDQPLNDLDLTEDRANSLKRKIGSFKVVKKVDHVIGNDVVKEAAVVIPTDSYEQDSSSIKNTDEAEKAIQALHKEFLKHVHRDSQSEARKSKERLGESAVYFTRVSKEDISSPRPEKKLEISRPRSIYGEPRLRSLSTGDLYNLQGNISRLNSRAKSWRDENEERLNSLHVDLRGIIGSMGRLEDSSERRNSGSPLFEHVHKRQKHGLEMVTEVGSDKLDSIDGTKDVTRESEESSSDVFEEPIGHSLPGETAVEDLKVGESELTTENIETNLEKPPQDPTSGAPEEKQNPSAQSLFEDKAVKDLTLDECHVVKDRLKPDLDESVRPLSTVAEEGTSLSSSSRASSVSQESKSQDDALQITEGKLEKTSAGVESATPISTDKAVPSGDTLAGLQERSKSSKDFHRSKPKRPRSLEIKSTTADSTELSINDITEPNGDSTTSNSVLSKTSQQNQSTSTPKSANATMKNGTDNEVQLRKIKMIRGRRPFSAVEPRNIPSSPTENNVQLRSFRSHIEGFVADTIDSNDVNDKQDNNVEVAEEVVEETSPKRPPRTKGKLIHSSSFATPSREKVKRVKNTKSRSRWQTLSEADWVSRLSPARPSLDLTRDEPVTLVTDALPASIPNFPTHKRAQVALELYTTERTYVRGLETVIELFKTPLDGYLDAKEMEVMFSNINGIFQLNKDVLFTLCEKVTHWKDEQKIGDVFADMAPRFKIYASYCTNYDAAENLIKQKIKRKKEFEAFLNACYNDPICQPGLTLQAYLITIVQRIPRYLLLLRDLVKCTPAHHPDATTIREGLQKMNNIAEYINNQLQAVQGQRAMAELRSRVIGIKAFETPGRSLIKEGEVYLMSTKKTYKCLLFNDMIVFAAKNVNKHSEVELTLELKTLWVCDLDDNDPQTNKEDAIEIYTPERSYTMYAAGSKNEKRLWLQKLKTAIAIQLLGEEATENSEIATRKTAFTFKDGRIYCGCFVDAKTHGNGVLAWPNRTRYVGDFEDGERNGTGELTYNTGEKYKGEWKDDKQHGNGTLTFPNGDVYAGEWMEGRMHGKGVIKFSNNDVLNGEFVDGEVCGWARLECSNDLFYEGTWKHSKKHGKGKLIKPNGDTYEGEFLNDRIHGKGKMVYSKTKATYEGQWENNHRHGIGTYCIPNGAVYEGEWSSDHIQGRGKMVYGNGEVYEGSWFRDMRFGKGLFKTHEGVYEGHFEYNLRHKFGLMQYNDGSEYEGEWQNDQREGQGKMLYADSGVYEGNWFHNLRHGRGKMIYPNRATYEGAWDLDSPHGADGVYLDQTSNYSYEGDWVHGRKEGKGVEKTANGTYEGEFKANVRHGKGVETLKGGIVFEGNWRDNRKVGEGVRRTKWGNNETTEIQQWKEGQLLNKDESIAPDLPFLQRH